MRVDNEITPLSAQNSKTRDDNEQMNGAQNALDLDFGTKSKAIENVDGAIWFKVLLDSVYCLEKLTRYSDYGKANEIRTCTSTDCDTCEGLWCDNQNQVEVTTERSSDVLSSVPTCILGDTIILIPGSNNNYLNVAEIAIFGNLGKNIPSSFIT